MKNIALVITSINENTNSFKIYDNLKSHDLILVGDKKGPKNPSISNGIFLDISTQVKLNFNSTQVLPYNHYSRKNLGYLYAMENGYHIIFETDDDNLPKPFFPPLLEQLINIEVLSSEDYFVNIYNLYSNLNLWPRGFPLKKINKATNYKSKKNQVKIGLWQGLADLDPDVDAINRMVFNYQSVKFRPGRYVIDYDNYCPFNSQNTLWYKETFPLLYLPSTVPFRMTDILRGFIAQRIMWEFDFRLGFHEATVDQERNDHDLLIDFNDEFTMYKDTEEIINTLKNINIKNKSMTDCLKAIYLSLIEKKFVDETEMVCLKAWINDVNNIINK